MLVEFRVVVEVEDDWLEEMSEDSRNRMFDEQLGKLEDSLQGPVGMDCSLDDSAWEVLDG